MRGELGLASDEITEQMLSYFIRKVHRRRSLIKPRVVISVPSGITAVEKRAVLNSAERAGAVFQQVTPSILKVSSIQTAELIKLYAARQAAPGRAFNPDSPWQRELEDAFPFVETPDQASTIDEVKRDMERPVPMD